MTEPTVTTTDPKQQTALAMSVLRFVETRIKPAMAELREQATTQLAKKDRVAAVSPIDGTTIGTITKSNPKAEATVTDRRAVYAWIRDNYPERLEVRTDIVGPQAEVIRVLEEHAPHLLDDSLKLPDYVVNELLTKSAGAGVPVGWGGEMDVPGITVSVPEGTVSVRLEKDIEQAVIDLIRGGAVEIDGTVHALPAGDTTAE